jgi:hypothetical protein
MLTTDALLQVLSRAESLQATPPTTSSLIRQTFLDLERHQRKIREIEKPKSPAKLPLAKKVPHPAGAS